MTASLADSAREGVFQSPRPRVLLVEDDIPSADALAELLDSWGWMPVHAADGETALALLPAVDPDVVLLDLGLPDISGWDVASAVRPRGTPPRPMVAVLSACSPDPQRASESGVLWHFTKPAGLTALRRVLEKYRRTLHSR